PDYIVPATVSFVAADAQFTPKTVETTDERAKLMFRIKLKIDPQVLQQFYTRVKTGVRGMGFVRTKAGVEWPADLEVKLPNPPQAKTPASAPPQAAAPGAQTPDAKSPETTAPDAK
ncbi:MAG TPA: efflux transporter periplasmic adaptor subunit, partial [Stellaceae bacterium]|nr:efflux transporter periplasmic adaptor subunit [Stellaceae bacterium]